MVEKKTPQSEPKSTDLAEMNDAVGDQVEPDGGWIVYRQNYTDSDGVMKQRDHGPMPRSEWDAYEREHNL